MRDRVSAVRTTRACARGGLVAVALAVAFIVGPPSPAAAQSLFLQVNTPSITLAPTPTDYVRDYVELTGASGIQLRIKTNNPVGMSVLVRCADASPRIALNDLLVRTLTPPGIGGAATASYTPLRSTNQFLWSTGQSVAPFFIIGTDVRVQNIGSYDDSPFAGTTAYTNTLVFTVVAQ
jgi:hypothetical protein